VIGFRKSAQIFEADDLAGARFQDNFGLAQIEFVLPCRLAIRRVALPGQAEPQRKLYLKARLKAPRRRLARHRATGTAAGLGWLRRHLLELGHAILTEDDMLDRNSIAGLALAGALLMTMAGAQAFDETNYPDWSGQWRKPQGIGNQWDQTKPPGRAQQAPLTAEYQAIFEASLADQSAGGQGGDIRITCVSTGMPRMMTAVRPFEFVITPKVTYVNFENNQPRRIYTDGRSFPKDEEATWSGYSIGKWLDTDGDGRFDTLEVETRNFKGPRVYEASGIPLHSDNESIVHERITLDKQNNDLLRYEVTTIDHALTRPWTVLKTFRRERNVLWSEDQCSENNNHVVVGREFYFLSGDGYLMPTRKDQPPPDTRYFRTGR
jgi:hypothetical protein